MKKIALRKTVLNTKAFMVALYDDETCGGGGISGRGCSINGNCGNCYCKKQA